MFQYDLVPTRWGTFGLVARNQRLIATFLPCGKRDMLHDIRARFPGAIRRAGLLPRFQREVGDYFAGKVVTFTVHIDASDLPPFHRAVLDACRTIRFGKTATYADLARAAGNPNAARAVGGAMARNPLPLVVPCHRVLRSDGSLGGFSSPRGMGAKLRMLRLENPDFGKAVRSNGRRPVHARANGPRTRRTRVA